MKNSSKNKKAGYKIHYTSIHKKNNIISIINKFIRNIKINLEIRKYIDKKYKYPAQYKKKSIILSFGVKIMSVVSFICLFLKNIFNIFLTLPNKSLLSKVFVSAISLILFFVIANFGIKTVSKLPLKVVYAKPYENTSLTYNKLVSEISKEVAKEKKPLDVLPIKKNTVSNFYATIASDKTLAGEGTIGLKYDEYIIKEGDNLTTLATRIGATLDTIVSVNKISNANKLRPGQKLKIPNRNGLLYTVKRNETLEEISETYNIAVDKILSFNKIDSPNSVDVGLDLFLPGARYTLDERIERFGQLFSLPVEVFYRISSSFGYRVDPFSGTRTQHKGMDIPGPLNTPVYAAKQGVVTFAGYSGGYGNLVIVRHKSGYTTYYGHLNSIVAKEGQTVGVGTLIGRMGSTGRSTGSHLHFEIRQNGIALNPAEFIPVKKYMKK